MKKSSNLFIAYFPVILVAGQVIVNLLSFIDKEAYQSAGFYLNTFFGTNVFFAVLLLVMTLRFRFCSVSKWAAVAELLFAVNYMVVKEDNLYNILFQIIVGVIAIIATFWYYIKKFPMCRMSLVMSFYKSVIKERSCTKGLEAWERNIKRHHLNHHHESKL